MRVAKVGLVALALVFAMIGTATGQDLTGTMLVGAYGGYSLGLGDPFGEQKFTFMNVNFESSLDPSISFGGTFHYGVTEKLMIGGEIGMQSYKAEASSEEYEFMGFTVPAMSASETETKINILASGLYAINQTDEGAFFVTFGGGIYGGLGGTLDVEEAAEQEIEDDSGAAFGINGGIVYRKMVSATVGFFVMPRIHFVFSDPSAKMAQIAVGLHFPLGGQ